MSGKCVRRELQGFRPGQVRDRIEHTMGLRPAMIAVLLTVAAAAAAAPPVATPLLAKASASEPAHKTVAQKPARIVDLDWKQLLPENERSHFTAVAPPPV